MSFYERDIGERRIAKEGGPAINILNEAVLGPPLLGAVDYYSHTSLALQAKTQPASLRLIEIAGFPAPMKLSLYMFLLLLK